MQKNLFVSAISIGFAMFSMFFGAGNVAFPILLGQYAGAQNRFAILGMLITAVAVPFFGLGTMLTYNGNYEQFFERLGKKVGLFLIFLMMLLIGPFGASPRCISLSYSTFNLFSSSLSNIAFGALACVLIFVLTMQQKRVVDILGIVLTPLLLISLGIIIVYGLYNPPPMQMSMHQSSTVFLKGLSDGYQTMDLFASFFFSIVIIPAFQRVLGEDFKQGSQAVARLALASSLVGIILLGVIYTGMSFVAAHHASLLEGVSSAQQLGTIAMHILGPYAGLVSNMAVALACLTTAMTLTVVFADYMKKKLFNNHISYQMSLLITLAITFFVSCLGFDAILRILAPILMAITPVMIVLTLCNFLHRFFGFPYVKGPVALSFLLSLGFTYFT